MISVEEVSRTFGRRVALDRATFAVGEHELVGLVGPNGAGKTTALRIIVGFLDPDRGRVKVEGKLGYLPESAPLPPESTVREYLAWRARVKRAPAGAVDRAMETTAITDVASRVIATLSKGYRQRVGLADALVADPPVLVLDEPQSGLDPVQVRELRAVLAGLSGTRTILVASHNVVELEALASRIVLIAGGAVIADDTPAALRGDAATLEDAVVDRLGAR
ncbi:MAG TPA: ABC transporter ATP-binding protein [Kofleriaceae bacterium]|nr:ABC transporter ATP-binding protein [Kofleriaceae bacterium]